MDGFFSSFLIILFLVLCSEVVDGGYVLKTTPLSWVAAKAWCEDQNTHLYTQSELGQWADLSSQVTLPANSSFWIGLSWSSSIGDFRWTDNSEINNPYWSVGEPNNATGYHCVLQNTTDGLWSTEPCSAEHNFVCQPGPPATMTYNTPYPRPPMKRDNNAVMWEGLLKGFACAGGLILLVAVVMHLPCCRNWVKKKEDEVNSWQEHLHKHQKQEQLEPVTTIG